MKRVLILLLSIVLLLSLAACGENNAAASGANQPAKPEQNDNSLPSAAESTGETGSAGSASLLPVNDSADAYSQVYHRYETTYSAITNAANELLDANNAKIEQESEQAGTNYWENPNHFSDVVSYFANIPIAFTATFGDNGYQTDVAALFEMFEMQNGAVEELDNANYRMTYTAVYNDPETWESTEDAQWEALCGFDGGCGSLYFHQSVTANAEQKPDSLIEFVPLGGGRYALQSRNERCIVQMLDGKADTFEYAAFRDPFTTEHTIFPNAAGVDDAWITAGQDMYQHITLTRDALHVWAAADSVMDVPERDITIAR